MDKVDLNMGRPTSRIKYSAVTFLICTTNAPQLPYLPPLSRMVSWEQVSFPLLYLLLGTEHGRGDFMNVVPPVGGVP